MFKLSGRKCGYLLTMCVLLPLSMRAYCDPAAKVLQQQWDHIMFELPQKQQQAEFASLAEKADALVKAYPRDADVLTWAGIIHSTYAGAKGGLGALSEVKKARVLLEDAIAVDPSASQGAAYTSLGSLYYQVPGWPVSFGNDDMANRLLKKGLVADVTGIDANYFYGDFLLHDKQYDKALDYLQRAMNAPPRPGREIADAGRRRQIEAAIKLSSEQLAK
jgi:tetratricopeptide (TPR) repeat protein